MATITSTSTVTTTTLRLQATINRVHILLHSILILFLLYYRAFSLLNPSTTTIKLAWTLISLSELTLAVIWLLTQSFRWQPVLRTAHPERLRKGQTALPGLDVFICTADPKKEPTLEVMNTVISAMSLDYPPDKLSVYLSDDGGASVTLNAMREAEIFAKCWVPFCRNYGIKTSCPAAYFSTTSNGNEGEGGNGGDQFKIDEENAKSQYEKLKRYIESEQYNNVDSEDINNISGDGRAPLVQVIHDGRTNEHDSEVKMPLLVYVSREKRPSCPHRFKAGALNTLLRVSGILSNSPYILVLDCDMYCNDPTSARQAMCFHLDHKISPALAFVQYPQIFYNVSKNDIYDGQARSAYKTKWQGMDGLRGPVLSGTGFFIKRVALFASPHQVDDSFRLQSKSIFGHSDMFIASLNCKDEGCKEPSKERLQEAQFLATCTFEKGTKWGSEIGFSYECLLESTFTGYLLHCKGWRSVYSYPKRPCFLGCTTIDMKDAMVQLRKWNAGLLGVALSKYSPLTYALPRMSILQTMCYGYFTFMPILAFALLIYGSIPQFCFYKGIPLFPKVTDPFFVVFSMIWASSLVQHLYEVLSSGSSLRTWWNEQRIWIMKVVAGSLFGCIDVFMKLMGINKTIFRLTNKAIDKEKLDKYDKGNFDFQGAKVFMVPLVLLVIWNIACFIGGLRRMVIVGNFDEMFGQFVLSLFILVVSYPIIEGMVTRKRKGGQM